HFQVADHVACVTAILVEDGTEHGEETKENQYADGAARQEQGRPVLLLDRFDRLVMGGEVVAQDQEHQVLQVDRNLTLQGHEGPDQAEHDEGEHGADAAGWQAERVADAGGFDIAALRLGSCSRGAGAPLSEIEWIARHRYASPAPSGACQVGLVAEYPFLYF